ncbi:hypothetical protein P3X46_020386 [Hevea brasiliensis]|uniref:Secretory carrier-associated membrane protein n=1 Tax=Hevea brasiliensis TaxID=3981 RepID=A0ABQ9LQW0_HEVBR|nr:secretory carrier-associated membrane protein 1 [Hevea brasiliensis]KAJ9168909.1 hypothetical protein P3X46_020386 [Hevea brasiliensis]
MAAHYDNTSPLNKAKVQPLHNESEGEPQKLQNFAFGAYLGLVVCLSWNLVAVTCLWILGGAENITLLLAIAVLVLGVPAAYASWYRTLSLAFREEDNASKFHEFLLLYLIHLAFCVFASINTPGKYLTGIQSAMDVYLDNHNLMIGIFYLIGSVLFYLEFWLSFWVMMRVQAYYRHRQGGLASVDQDLTLPSL